MYWSNVGEWPQSFPIWRCQIFWQFMRRRFGPSKWGCCYCYLYNYDTKQTSQVGCHSGLQSKLCRRIEREHPESLLSLPPTTHYISDGNDCLFWLLNIWLLIAVCHAWAWKVNLVWTRLQRIKDCVIVWLTSWLNWPISFNEPDI